MERQRKRGRGGKKPNNLETCTHSVQHAIEWKEAAIPAVFPHLQGTWHLVNIDFFFFPCFFLIALKKQTQQKLLSMTQWGVVVKHQKKKKKKQPSFLRIKLHVLLPPPSCLHSIYQQEAKPDWPALNEELFYLLKNQQPWLGKRAMAWLSFLYFIQLRTDVISHS